MGAKPRLRHGWLPTITIGDGVVLRPFTKADQGEVFALVDAHRRELGQWLPWVHRTLAPGDLDNLVAYTAEAHKTKSGALFCVVVGDRVAGIASLERIFRFHDYGYIGYWLSPWAQGRGLMTAAVRALLEFAFGSLGLNLIEIRAVVSNRRSRAIPERLGFNSDGVLRQRERLGDSYRDQAVYSMLASEWKKSSGAPR